MNKWQARKAHQELASDIEKFLDTPQRVEPLPRIGWKLTRFVRREIWCNARTLLLKAVK